MLCCKTPRMLCSFIYMYYQILSFVTLSQFSMSLTAARTNLKVRECLLSQKTPVKEFLSGFMYNQVRYIIQSMAAEVDDSRAMMERCCMHILRSQPQIQIYIPKCTLQKFELKFLNIQLKSNTKPCGWSGTTYHLSPKELFT